MPVSRRECEFFLMKYVPDPVRNEFVHVGVVLREMGRDGGPSPVASVRFTSDWRRVRCLDPEADTGMLEGLESELRRRFLEEPEGNLMHVLEDSFSNSVQMTRGKAYLAESIETGVEELMRMYVEPQKRERVSRLSGRAAIQAAMRTEFERAGVWDLLRKRIAVSEYTRPGDPLRIDLGYLSSKPPNGVIRMFQAVSLETSSGAGLEAAKALAFSAPGLAAGVERVEKAALELTAVVEPLRQGPPPHGRGPVRGGPGLGTREQGIGTSGRGIRGGAVAGGPEDDELDSERVAAYRFAVETREEHRIRVVTTVDLGRVAEAARRELRV
jgi:Protein of unknown function (DUF3037)